MNCYNCSYFRDLKEKLEAKGYCEDRDCTVDPLDPECQYD